MVLSTSDTFCFTRFTVSLAFMRNTREYAFAL